MSESMNVAFAIGERFAFKFQPIACFAQIQLYGGQNGKIKL